MKRNTVRVKTFKRKVFSTLAGKHAETRSEVIVQGECSDGQFDVSIGDPKTIRMMWLWSDQDVAVSSRAETIKLKAKVLRCWMPDVNRRYPFKKNIDNLSVVNAGHESALLKVFVLQDI